MADDIELAFVFGSVAAGQDGAGSDIDLMVVTHSLDYTTLFNALQTAEQALDRPVNPKSSRLPSGPANTARMTASLREWQHGLGCW